ncbi:hypothetical protein VHEMI03203 [[Torrubiella] hemipterigena]|uniref:ABC transmembrane type-1 domain-containing protein n=1 Tax=[Torrubiella] hemipterigena TaxID=1531966 RepID=A0A0A1TA83_9HYPO|nr:hypothetical protein VHEMI03203 [[Torrubiella] hemipterigena]
MLLTCIAQGAMIATGSGYMSAVIPICVAVLYAIQFFYLRTSRQIRLLGLESKAPLYDHSLQTIDGGATIRASQWQDRFTETGDELLDLSQKPFYALYSVQQWLQVVLDLLVARLAILLTGLVLFVTNKSTSGSVGVALVNLLSFNTSLTQLITNWMQLETSLGAISRIKDFVSNPDYKASKAPEGGAHGQELLVQTVEFRNVSASYGKGEELVLSNISLSLKGGHSILFFTQKRWDEHVVALEQERLGNGIATWDAEQYLPQGTCGAVAMDEHGVICAAISTGGLTNKISGRVGDTPLPGAGFWAEEWTEARDPTSSYHRRHLLDDETEYPKTVRRSIDLSSTVTGDSFLRIAAARTVAGMAQWMPVPGAVAVAKVAGPDGALQQSAEGRWGTTGEDADGNVAERRSEILMDCNCAGMYRAWTDDNGKPTMSIWTNGERDRERKALHLL